MRKAAATLIRAIRGDVRRGDCGAARRDFDQLVPLVGRMGPATKARVKSRTVARLWGLVESCRWKGPLRGARTGRRRRR